MEEYEERLGALDEYFDPGLPEYLAYRSGMLYWRDFQRYGMPVAGGYQEQRADWIFVMHTVQTASERAESVTRHEEEVEQHHSSQANSAPTEM